RLAGSCGGIGRFRLVRLRLVLRAAARLRLTPLEVLPQRRPQPRLAGDFGAGFGVLAHAARLEHRLPASKPPIRLLPGPGRARRNLVAEWRPVRYSNARRCRSSVVEHPLGKGEVVSSILTGSTRQS